MKQPSEEDLKIDVAAFTERAIKHWRIDNPGIEPTNAVLVLVHPIAGTQVAAEYAQAMPKASGVLLGLGGIAHAQQCLLEQAKTRDLTSPGMADSKH